MSETYNSLASHKRRGWWFMLTVICTMASFVAPASPARRLLTYNSVREFILADQKAVAAITPIEIM